MISPCASKGLARWDRTLASRWWVVVVLLVWLCFSLPSLQSYPSVDTDEAMFSAVGYDFYETGQFRLYNLGREFGSGGATHILHGRLYAVVLGGALRAVGVGAFQARLAPLAATLLSGLLVRSMGRALGLGRAGSLMAMSLFLLSWRIFSASHSARPEAAMILAGLMMALLYLRSARMPTVRQYLIFGFVVAYGLDVHLPTVFYSAATAALVGIDFLRRQLDRRLLAAFVMGGLLGLGVWAMLWLLPDPAAALAPWRLGPLAANTPDSITRIQPAGAVVSRFMDWFIYNFITSSRLGGIELIIIAAAILGLLLVRWQAERFLLVWGGLLLAVLFLSPYRHDYHDALLMPPASLLAARFGEAAAHSRFNTLPFKRLATLAVAAPLAVFYLAGDLSLAWRSRPIDFERYAAALRAYVPAGANVLGEEVWWFEFSDGRFSTDRTLMISVQVGGVPAEAGEFVKQMLVSRAVDYVLLDGRLASAWLDPLPAAEAAIYPSYAQAVSEVCERVGEVDLPLYGVERGGPANKVTTVWKCSGDR